MFSPELILCFDKKLIFYFKRSDISITAKVLQKLLIDHSNFMFIDTIQIY